MYDNSKRKIRGWKRRIGKIDRWRQNAIVLDKESLEKHQRDYVKLWIHPFYSIPRRNPPIWYNRKLLEAMLDVHASWHQTMIQDNEPFYLKIWLYDPHFINSQIVVANKENLHFYDHTFDDSLASKGFPFEKFISLKDKLLQFDWKLHIDSDVYTESDLIDNVRLGWSTVSELEQIQKKAYRTETINLGDGTKDKTYSIKVGDVWVGSLKTSN
ncbi:MAG: hypothetical protein ACE3L7_09485 [Candidatus Pristimantibacillus sp.]